MGRQRGFLREAACETQTRAVEVGWLANLSSGRYCEHTACEKDADARGRYKTEQCLEPQRVNELKMVCYCIVPVCGASPRQKNTYRLFPVISTYAAAFALDARFLAEFYRARDLLDPLLTHAAT